MPQLNPAPWFAIMLFTWLVFTTTIPQKVLAHTFPKDPSPQSVEKPKAEFWNWPWH